MTPRIVSVGIFYVAIVLAGFWLPWPETPFVLALLATVLDVGGFFLAIPDNAPLWANVVNRASDIGTVWLATGFVWYIRILAERLQAQIDISNTLSREMTHRVGNSLQLVASYLRLRAGRAASPEAREVLQTAGSHVMRIGRIQRMLSHAGSAAAVNSQTFFRALLDDVSSTLSDPDAIRIRVEADAAELTSSTAITLGALLIELINNALKHAFQGCERGALTVKFTCLPGGGEYVLDVEDDGVGMHQAQVSGGSGIQSVTELVRLMHGSIACEVPHPSSARPGTRWHLVFPHPTIASSAP
jgi:two-component sensor histidine kinase